MVRVSGVPYEVELEPNVSYDEMISMLELENKFIRARMERLEHENEVLLTTLEKMRNGHRTD
jgi:hypothetical protein